MPQQYSIIERGSLYTKEYRLYISGPNGPVSAFHDIPLHANPEKTLYNMVVEIPRWTNAKMEICKELRLNPIVQDVKKEKLRFVDNVFPHHGYIWNYGALPQTWEDPGHVDEDTKAKGDNDPLDACEIGSRVHPRGSVIKVKPLAILGLIDEGETDWKVLVIDVTDPMADSINCLADIEEKMPGFLEATRQWFRDYKIPQGKPPNVFAYEGEFQDRNRAIKVIEETHKQWQALIGHVVDRNGIQCDNVSVIGSAYKIQQNLAKEVVEMAPACGQAKQRPERVDKWHYVCE